MKEYIDKYFPGERLLYTLSGVVIIIILASAAGFGFLFRDVNRLKGITASSTARIVVLEAELATSTLTSKELAERLLIEQQKSDSFEESISDISGTVNTLEKLSKTDKELLQKYSKVYFLSDNYVPLRLKNIDTDFLFETKTDLQFHALALPYLERMIKRAVGDDVDLKVVSAYRSFGTQSALKSGYLVSYGSGANQFSADQGYSEHQLGTTVDLTVAGASQNLTIGFESTPAYVWLTKNAYKYGFVLSYPKNNAYYQFEPWHWRFVGIKLATSLHNDDLNFSDMDQRDIDKYLVKIFD